MKDIFQTLQEFENIPASLNVEKCKFLVKLSKESEIKKGKIHYEETIAEVIQMVQKITKQKKVLSLNITL